MDTFKVTVSACRAALSKESKYLELFDSTFRETIASFSMDLFLESGCTISPCTNVSALQTACQTVSSALLDAYDPTDASTFYLHSLSTVMWNPVLAAIVANLQPSKPTTTDLAKAGNHRTHAQANATHHQPSTSKQNAPSRTAKKGKTAQDPEKTVKLSFDESQVKKDLEDFLKSAKSYLFPTFTRCCGKSSCARCIDIFRTLPLTSCHQAHGPSLCVPSGWFPHMTGSLWSKISGAHNKAEVWKWSPPPLRDGQHLNPLSVDDCASSVSGLSLEASESMNWGNAVDLADPSISTSPLSPEYQPARRSETPTPPPTQIHQNRVRRVKRKGSPPTVRKGKKAAG